ncbi:MAG: Sec-independent protein translocase protein TatB [gamma proteobacterium symbiont of Lucinoma myriamae]|nr:Sec-independent protein translocase protein TatB [gamma proteobacterium symbiont of Lucinoma myriamae]MCU7817822.1 Sec-independent protein translocase protein TatB [gamma proteobacterium symbiont of Lucinoma myriamae]MCU7832184.1 Sec-independent protein translocase protein TatB [gamma proteobacterium symbiont of Lucinoma myriamae]
MFDIGFWELSIIGIVALLVIGPERLPAVARTVGKYVGRANRFVSNIKDDISKELKDEDLKRILADQQKLADEYKNAASAMNASIASETESLRGNVSMDDILDIEESEQKSIEKKASATNESDSSDSAESTPAGTEKS